MIGRQDEVIIMASQLLPLGEYLRDRRNPAHRLTGSTELIDKCVGSRIWVIMKGDKGTAPQSVTLVWIQLMPDLQNSAAHCLDSMTTSVCITTYGQGLTSAFAN